MGILERFFGDKATVVTANHIRNEITRGEAERSTLHEKEKASSSAIATMTDAEHIAMEADNAAIKRAIARLDARIATLNGELPTVIAAEEAAKKAATDEALRQRAEAARKAVNKEAAKLLAEYDKLASQLSDVLARLKAISTETNSVNEQLRANPVAERIAGYDLVHRKNPDREASEVRETRDVWVYADGTVVEAVKNAESEYLAPTHWVNPGSTRTPRPRREQREITVARTPSRAGKYELSLSSVILPPGFSGGTAHWPPN